MNFQVYYNNGTIIRVDYDLVANGTTTPISKYYSLPLQSEIDPTTTVLTMDMPQPFQINEKLCCVSKYEVCDNVRCGLTKALDNNWVVENVLLFNKRLSVRLHYLTINGVTVLTDQFFFMQPTAISTYVDTTGLIVYTNLFDWLYALFAPFNIFLELGVAFINNELVEVMTLNYNSCDIQTYEFKLTSYFEDTVGFEDYVANETGYIEVEGSTSEYILFYYKHQKDCISVSDFPYDDP